MTPPIFSVCAASPAVTALLGSNPTRVFAHGEAPDGVAWPYMVWQVIGGSPASYLGDLPDIDSMSIQVDVYGETGDSARAVVVALRDAIEPHAHITSWRGGSRDPETRSFRQTFDLDWFVQR